MARHILAVVALCIGGGADSWGAIVTGRLEGSTQNGYRGPLTIQDGADVLVINELRQMDIFGDAIWHGGFASLGLRLDSSIGMYLDGSLNGNGQLFFVDYVLNIDASGPHSGTGSGLHTEDGFIYTFERFRVVEPGPDERNEIVTNPLFSIFDASGLGTFEMDYWASPEIFPNEGDIFVENAVFRFGEVPEPSSVLIWCGLAALIGIGAFWYRKALPLSSAAILCFASSSFASLIEVTVQSEVTTAITGEDAWRLVQRHCPECDPNVPRGMDLLPYQFAEGDSVTSIFSYHDDIQQGPTIYRGPTWTLSEPFIFLSGDFYGSYLNSRIVIRPRGVVVETDTWERLSAEPPFFKGAIYYPTLVLNATDALPQDRLPDFGNFDLRVGEWSLTARIIGGSGGSSSSIPVRANVTSISTMVYQAGDANQDGAFNQLDLVRVLQQNRYLTDIPAVWSQGDFTGDGLFNQLDIIEAIPNYDSRTAQALSLPEPSGMMLVSAACLVLASRKWPRPTPQSS